MSLEIANSTRVLKDIVASVVGSAACVYTGQPFDTVKVRMQVQPGDFSTALDCCRKTFQGEGLTALWKGSVPALVGALAENAAAFGINGSLKRFMNVDENDATKEVSYVRPFVTGGITGACTAFVLCPCDVVKCRAQLSRAQGMETSIRDIILSCLKTSGVRGLYTGIGAQIMRDVPFYATFFGSYEIMCQIFKRRTTLPETSIFFISGGFAGQIAWLASIGPDTIKSRIQTSLEPLSIRETAKDILRTRGVKGVLAGVEVAIIRAFPANAALFVGYETARKMLG